MSTNLVHKKIHFVPFAVGLLLLSFLAACTGTTTAVTAQPADNAPANGSITVIGRGEAFGTPDEAHAQVGVEIFADTAAEATAQNEATMQLIMEVLTAQGIAPEDIQTSNYSLWAEQFYGERGPEGIVGYRVNNQVSITIRDLSKIGEVLAATTDAGANAIHGVFFTVSDPAALEAEARASAMENARQRAESLAQLSGVALGNVQMISEVVGQPVMPFGGGGGFDMAMEMAASAPTLSPGQLNYQVQIQVTYTIN